jgi:hypothetical protein
MEKEETGSDTKVPLEHGDSEDYPYDDEEQTDNQGRASTLFYLLLLNSSVSFHTSCSLPKETNLRKIIVICVNFPHL